MFKGIVRLGKRRSSVRPDRIGLLGKPPSSRAFVPLQEPVVILA